MNLLRLLLLLGLFQAPQQQGSIDGFVVKLGTSEPVSKARVTLTRYQSRGEAYSATTESGGRFSFQNLEPGQYRLSVQRNGYVRTEYGQRSLNRPGLPLTVNAGQAVKDIVLQLIPAGTITGRISDIDGEPLPNVNVQALRYMYREGERVLQSVQQARTNDLGEYRLFWLNPGQYYVSATYNQGQQLAIVGNSPIAGPGIGGLLDGARGARGNAGARGGRGADPQAGRGGAGQRAAAVMETLMSEPSEDEGYIPMYYPNTADATQAAAINLQPGLTYPNVDLTISPVRTLRVRGQVIDGTTGQPAPNTQVTLIPRREGIGIGMNQNLRGRNTNEGFEIRGVVPGSYDVMAMMNNRNARMTARIPIEVGAADVNNVTLVLSPGVTVSGRIMIEGRPPGSDDPELTRMRVNLRPIGGAGGPLGGPPPAGAALANGTFTLQRVGPGDYRVAVSGMPQGHYVKIARLGSVDVLSQGIRITEQPAVPLDILVSPNTAKLDGSVTDDKQQPAVNVTVVLVPDGTFRNRMDLYRVVSTDAAGRFSLAGIPPADYKIFAWEDVEQGAWQDPDFLRLYEDRGKSYRLGENSQTTAELSLIPVQM